MSFYRSSISTTKIVSMTVGMDQMFAVQWMCTKLEGLQLASTNIVYIFGTENVVAMGVWTSPSAG